MALFDYRALQLDGAITEGNLVAEGRQDAFRQMEGKGLKPISLAEARPAAAGRRRLESRMEVEQNYRTHAGGFYRLLSSLLAAGISLSRALVILHKEASS